MQVYYCYNYVTNSRNTTLLGFCTRSQFVRAWNNLPNNIDHLFIMVHGDRKALYFLPTGRNGEDELSNLIGLKRKRIKCKIWLFSCCGGISMANKFAYLCIGTPVVALNSNLSYSWSGIGYSARPEWGKYGFWTSTRYYEEFRYGKHYIFYSSYTFTK